MRLYLIDGNSYVYRAFHAIRGLTDSKGRPTNAIYGFTNTLLRIMREQEPDGLAISFDSAEPTERHKVFEEYKAHRPETPDDLVAQLPAIRDIIDAMRIPVYKLPGYEADDILATIARKAEAEGHEVFIVTGDKDMLQLVTDRVLVYDPMKDAVFDREHVIGRFGVPPERVTEFMALTGDAVDNIPGVKGIGEKTARELLTTYGSLEELLTDTTRVKRERIRKLIEENVDMARLSRQLAEIDRNVPIDVDLNAMKLREPDRQALIELFREYEFASLIQQVPGGGAARKECECETVTNTARLKELVSGIKGHLAVDTEATGTDPMSASLVGFSVSAERGSAFYVPLGHRYLGVPAQANASEALGIIKPVLEDESIPKTGHNIKYDMLLLKRNGVDIKGPIYDTMVASYLINPTRPNHSLDYAAMEYLSMKKMTFSEVAPGGDFASVPVEDAAPYACEDAESALELKEVLFERMASEGVTDLYNEIEMPLIRILAGMEEAGVRVDCGHLSDISKELDTKIEALTKRIYFLSGGEFNINSPKQLSRVLFEELGLTPGKKKKTGYSTDTSVLEELAKVHELPAEILNYRSLYKLKNTYLDVLPGLVNKSTGRIHTSFNQTVTATGRLSSSEPNLQNIPIRGELGTRIREAFVAEEGCVLVSADYSQIELRILAHISGDKGLIEAFRKGVDIHSRTASEIFGVPVEKVTSEMRRAAKGVNFGVIYGISPFGLAEAIGVGQEEARQYIDRYFQSHPGVKAYMDGIIKKANDEGYVTTLFGRKRPIPEIKNPRTRQMGERLALNSPIQGTAADVIKIAMIRINESLAGTGARMILQVHDELLVEAPKEKADEVMAMVREGMEGVTLPPVTGTGSDENVPLLVEAGTGLNWAEAH